MTEITVRLPDDLAQRARRAGLLSDSSILVLLEDAIRLQAGRRLMEVADHAHAAGARPMMSKETGAGAGRRP